MVDYDGISAAVHGSKAMNVENEIGVGRGGFRWPLDDFGAGLRGACVTMDGEGVLDLSLPAVEAEDAAAAAQEGQEETDERGQ